MLLARNNGFAVFLAASLLSKLRSFGDPIVLIFMGLVLAVLTAVLWPAVFAGALVAVLIEGVALWVAWLRLRPFLDNVTRWDLVGEAAAADHEDHTRVISAFRILRLVWSRVATWPVAVSSASLFLVVIMADHQYESWRRARPFRALRAEDVAAYQRKVKILVKGDEAFQLNVCNIIKLLEDKAPDKFAYVQEHVKIIKPGVWYGYVGLFDPPVVCLSNDRRYSLELQAGILVHEAAHIQAGKERSAGQAVVLGDVPASSSSHGDLEQRACDRFGAEAMRAIGAPANEVTAFTENRDTSGTDAVVAMIAASTLADTNLPGDVRSNQIWSYSLEDFDPALWKEWKAFTRGALPARAPKKSQLPRGAVPSDTKSKAPIGGKSP